MTRSSAALLGQPKRTATWLLYSAVTDANWDGRALDGPGAEAILGAHDPVHFVHDCLGSTVFLNPAFCTGRASTTRKHSLEGRTGPGNPALDRADCAAADLRGLLIGEPTRGDEDQRFPLGFRQAQQRALKISDVKVVLLRWRHREFPSRRGLVPLARKARSAHL